jgi:hypothetical protein
MSTQFDRIFEGLSTNSLTLEDACRVLYSESQASPDSMRVCCERIEIELSQGRITSDAAQLLLDALGERSQEEHHAAAAEEMWVDVPLEALAVEPPRPSSLKPATVEVVTEVDLTMDDLLAALDRRSAPAPAAKAPAEVQVADALASVEWMEWEPAEPAPMPPPSVSSAAAPAAEVEVLLQAGLDAQPSVGPVTGPSAAAGELPEPVPVEPLQAAAGEPVVVTHTEFGTTVPMEAVTGVALVPAWQSASESIDSVSVQGELVQVDDLVPVPILAEEVIESPVVAIEPAATMVASEPTEVVVSAAGSSETDPVAVFIDAGSLEDDALSAIEEDTDEAIEEVFAPRVEHVLRESSAITAGALLKDRYRILGPVAPGGLGQLFEAVDMQVAGAPRVILKLIDVDWQEEPRAFETLQAIVRHVRRLRHPNILAILDIDRDDRHAIIAMEALRGCWLSSLMREVRGRGVGYAVAWNIISGVANGLAYAHQHGAVHSELNPHMVFLTETGQVKIVGFGLAHAMPMSTEPLAELDGLTLRGYADAYCATQWILGSVPQGVDDLYPLGVIAYELLTGVHPFNRASPGVAASRQLQPLPIPGLDRRIRRVIERCLSFDRNDRPATGASFLAHMEPSEKLLDLVRDRFN